MAEIGRTVSTPGVSTETTAVGFDVPGVWRGIAKELTGTGRNGSGAAQPSAGLGGPVLLAAGIGGLILIVLMALMLLQLRSSGEHIAAQDAKVSLLLRESAPLLGESRQFLDETGALVKGSKPLARQARRSGLAGLLGDSATVLGDARRANLVDRAVDTTGRIEEMLAVQRQVLAVQRRLLAVQRRSFAVQLKTLRHVRNMDRRTGGRDLGR